MYKFTVNDGSISALFIVSVHPMRPTLTTSPSSGTSMVNHSLVLTCQSNSQGQQITYTFYNGINSVISDSPNKNHTINLPQADESTYFCQVKINGVISEKSSPQQVRFIGENFYSFISKCSWYCHVLRYYEDFLWYKNALKTYI